jgi:SAM-dependent methyltransferase
MTDPARVRAAYDAVAVPYADMAAGEPAERRPLDRAVLAAFAARVEGPVLDAGCGPGHVTARLRDLGLAVSGLDLSPAMVAEACRRYPGIAFSVGSMTELPHDLGGLVSWYSTVHTPDDELPGVLAGFAAALVPGGRLLLGFSVGDVPFHLEAAFGHTLALDFLRRRPDHVAALLTDAGLQVEARVERAADPDERAPAAFFVAARPEE